MTEFSETPLSRGEILALVGEEDYYTSQIVPRVRSILGEAGTDSVRSTLPEIIHTSSPIFLPGTLGQRLEAEVSQRRAIFGGEVIRLELRKLEADDTVVEAYSLTPSDYREVLQARRLAQMAPDALIRSRDVRLLDKRRHQFMSHLELAEEALRVRRTTTEGVPEDNTFSNPHLAIPVPDYELVNISSASQRPDVRIKDRELEDQLRVTRPRPGWDEVTSTLVRAWDIRRDIEGLDALSES